MEKSKKICFLIPSVSSGGIETYLLRFLKYHKSDHDITVIVRNTEKGELYDSYKSLDINLIFKPLGYINPKRIFEFYQIFKLKKFDVVCDFNANFSAIPLKVSKMLGVKKRVAFYRQGSDHFEATFFKKLINNYFNRTVYKVATDILLNSNAALSHFFSYRKMSDQRFDVIYNGVNETAFNIKVEKSDVNEIRKELGLNQDKFIIGHVGRLDSSKNHHAILNTAKKLLSKGLNVQFVLCGRNTKFLENEINRLKLENDFKLLGHRDDIPRILKSFDLFLFPSITEGQPNALIEAMLAKIPIVASDIDPIKECLPDSHLKYLCQPYDYDCFAKKIESLIVRGVIDTDILYKWAIDKFNAEKNFNLFENKLEI